MSGDENVLRGTWYRSFEEEQADSPELVYRPSGYAFPPTRAPRPALRFGGDDGPVTVTAMGAGPDDRSVPVGEPAPFTVVSAGPDRLVITERQEEPS